MKLLPRSLFARNALLIVALIVLGQIGGVVLLREMVLKPRLDQIAEGVARNVGAIRAGLVALPASQRPAFVDAFNSRASADQPQPGGEGLRLLLSPLERNFVRSVSARIAQQGAETVWRREQGGSLALRMTFDGSQYWIVMPGVLPAREFTGAWLAVTAGSALLALAGALWFQRRLDRPLQRAVEAARTLAAGREPAPLPEDGPTEVATVSRSFNQLVGSLRQAERERALMLAGISHDLRTPLTKLRLVVEILRDKTEPELATSMTRSIEEMDAIVGQFLDFARGDEAEPVAFARLDVLASEVQAACSDHGEPLQVEGAFAEPVPMRAQAMRRVMVNLVENAFRHGRAPVRLRLGGDRDHAWFEVLDRGDGLSPEEAESLKQPFRRAGSARSGKAGAGLGLAIVERIVRAHGGRFELLPVEGGGLSARVSLPRRRA
ncbi:MULTISPECIES: ATP-binding protein [unclassified Variovorax]|uniref:ATP-binding protein n=1 Tax=unclassified Variovorax TaxID=663243 RepID=UPI00076C5987|nr:MULTISPECIES: ATP-binding protein [unclassified Variovorax]KWT85247.1 Osmolarity sensor protein EnvZ [Variovorax sp. WDL1]PNG56681.1 Osmolarity sensor protein EnvZ [Variovorax sp. B4]PNG58105.1 Osmolarity sensor protein EnvZ [Variovorax sp. B2]VTV09401.1 Osmolarity sensor protein EnvZ [Variovorax sp. WDL1]